MSLKLSLGAIQYYWPKQTVFAWYDRIADTDADIIYLGETVCARRHELRLADWLAIADNLAASGKEVLLASQTLLESESDLKRLRKIAKQARYPIEANDMGAVKLARDHGHPFVAGASLNLYNEHTLALVRRLGAYRWQPPAELSRDKLATLLAASADPGEAELFAWGKIPLAYSSRCFTARHYNLNKDNCQFRCIEHPHGMTMDTREKTPFLTINGIQTMSHGSQCLLAHHADIAALGVNILRLSPQLEHMAEIIALHRQTLDGAIPAADALRELAPLALGALVDGYWYGNPGIEKIKTYYSEANAGPVYQPEEAPAIPPSTHAESPAARPLPCAAGEGRGGGVNTPRSDNANPPRAENQNPLPPANLPPPPQDAQRSQRGRGNFALPADSKQALNDEIAQGFKSRRMQGEIQCRFNQLDFVNEKVAVRVNQPVDAGVKRRNRQVRQHCCRARQPGGFGTDGQDFHAVGGIGAPFLRRGAAMRGVREGAAEVNQADFADRAFNEGLQQRALRVIGQRRQFAIKAAHAAPALADERFDDGVVPAAVGNSLHPIIARQQCDTGCDTKALCRQFAEVTFVEVPALQGGRIDDAHIRRFQRSEPIQVSIGLGAVIPGCERQHGVRGSGSDVLPRQEFGVERGGKRTQVGVALRPFAAGGDVGGWHGADMKKAA